MLRFQRAERAQTPDLAQAVIAQNQIDAQIHQGEQARKQGYYTAGADLASRVPEGAWSNLGSAITGGGSAAAPTATGTLGALPTSTVSGLSSAAPASGTLGALPGATAGLASPIPAATGAAGAGTAGAAGAGAGAGAAGAGAAGAGAAGGGVSGALAALGPVGWAALAALAAGALS